MSFRCELCNGVQDPGVSPTMVILERREVNYEQRPRDKKVIDSGGSGWEIVKEAMACPKCAKV